MPRKIFVAGEILTAADVNTNLMDQAVMVFADAAARTTAIPSPTEGMVTYLSDVNALEVYTGAAFVPAASGATLGSGSILQVVQGVKTDTFTSTSVAAGATVTVTGLSASITLLSTSSKVLVIVDLSGSNSGGEGWSVLLKRDGTAISVGGSEGNRTQVTSAGVEDSRGQSVGNSSFMVLDTPASVSALSYTIDILNNRSSSQNLNVNKSNADVNAAYSARTASRITLMEVAG